MELFLVEVEGHKYHSYGNEESVDFKKNHLVKANSEGEAKEKVDNYYKSQSEPYGGYVYVVYSEVQQTIE